MHGRAHVMAEIPDATCDSKTVEEQIVSCEEQDVSADNWIQKFKQEQSLVLDHFKALWNGACTHWNGKACVLRTLMLMVFPTLVYFAILSLPFDSPRNSPNWAYAAHTFIFTFVVTCVPTSWMIQQTCPRMSLRPIPLTVHIIAQLIGSILATSAIMLICIFGVFPIPCAVTAKLAISIICYEPVMVKLIQKSNPHLTYNKCLMNTIGLHIKVPPLSMAVPTLAMVVVFALVFSREPGSVSYYVLALSMPLVNYGICALAKRVCIKLSAGPQDTCIVTLCLKMVYTYIRTAVQEDPNIIIAVALSLVEVMEHIAKLIMVFLPYHLSWHSWKKKAKQRVG